MKHALLAILCASTSALPMAFADIALDGDYSAPLSVSLGLVGELFGSESVSVFWPRGSTQAAFNDGRFAARVAPDATVTVNAHMSSFQNAGDAQLIQTISNVGVPRGTAPGSYDFSHLEGWIRGRVTVIGGSVLQIGMRSVASIGANEMLSGYVSTQGNSGQQPVQPMAAVDNVRVYGTAVLRATANGGCDIPTNLADVYLNVAAGLTVEADWNFDLSTEQCDLGIVEGDASVAGLPADARIKRHAISAYGRVERSTNRAENATSYGFASLPDGSYRIFHSTYYGVPFVGVTHWPEAAASVARGSFTTVDLARSAGALRIRVIPQGAWGLKDTCARRIQFSSGGGSASDPLDTDGRGNLIAPVGNAYLSGLIFNFANSTSQGSELAYYAADFTAADSPKVASLTEGDDVDLGIYSLPTAESRTFMFIAKPDIKLTRVAVNAYQKVVDPETNQYLGVRRIHSGLRRTPGSATNRVSMLLRGEPGTYTFTATGEGDDGAIYTAHGTFVIGRPSQIVAAAM